MRSLGGFLKQFFYFLVLLAIVVLGRYSYYVYFEEDIYSEVGAGLQSVMPDPIKSWGCQHLAERFPDKSAPECY